MKSSRQAFLWLLTGAALMLFSNGRWIIPLPPGFIPFFSSLHATKNPWRDPSF
jgi:hypothetical protein